MRTPRIAWLLLGGAALLLLANNSLQPTQFIDYRPSADAIWSTASAAANAALDLLPSGSTQVSEDATAAALAGFRALGSTVIGSAVERPRAAAESQPAASAAAAAPRAVHGECLVTKWSAVWLVHSDHTRSHVGFPTSGCDVRAAPLEDLNAIPKAHGGNGAYFLDEAHSAAACKLNGCGLPAASATPAAAESRGGSANGQGMSAAPATASKNGAARHPMVPALGWGAGAGAGGSWMAQSALRFNVPATSAFTSLQLPPGEPLLLVFGGASVNDMLKNWVLHVRKLQMPFVVACMDESLFQLAEKLGYAAVMMNEGADGESRVSTRWKYYRMDPKAFLAMGILKVRFFMEFMRAGFDVLCSDLDVMWLSDPRPWIAGSANGAALLGLADVVVSTDVTHGNLDKDESAWGINNEMNTGMVLLRSSEGAMVFCRRWKARMEQEMTKVAKLSSAMVQWWTNDQTFFNEVVHASPTMHNAQIKERNRAKREAAAKELRDAAPSPARLAHLGKVIELISGAQVSGRPSDLETLATMRGLLFKRLSCIQHEGKDVCLGGGDVAKGQQTFTIATFPYVHFASGHTYFTQSLQERRGITPVAVHTTFQFGDTPEFTWGKRNRLREKRLWLVDDETYYQRRGPGPDAHETEYNGFLQLSGVLVEAATAPVLRTESSSSIKIEGDKAYADAMHANNGNVYQLTEGNPNRHLLLDAFQRRLVLNAVALGRALKRKVIMPRMTCWCDRYWWLLEDCRFPGVPRDQHQLPFHCPFDHVYDLEKWVHSDVPMREYSFLENARIDASDLADVVRLDVHGAPPAGSGARGPETGPMAAGMHTAPGGGAARAAAVAAAAAAASPTGRISANLRALLDANATASGGGRGREERTLSVGIGANYASVRDALANKGWSDAFVVTVDARSLELLCEDLGSAAANREFNQITHRVLGVAEQIRYCDRRANTWFDAPRGSYDPMRNPINCTWGFHRPPLLPESGSPTCLTSRAAVLAERAKETTRRWTTQGNQGIFANYNGVQTWSTNDRVVDYYRQYI